MQISLLEFYKKILLKRSSNPELNELIESKFQSLQQQIIDVNKQTSSQFTNFQRFSSQHNNNNMSQKVFAQNLSQHQTLFSGNSDKFKSSLDKHKKSLTQVTESSLYSSPLNKQKNGQQLISNKLNSMIGKIQELNEKNKQIQKLNQKLHQNSQPCINININQVSINSLFLNGQQQKLFEQSKLQSQKTSPMKDYGKTIENVHQNNYYHSKTQSVKKSLDSKSAQSTIRISAILQSSLKLKSSLTDQKCQIRSFNSLKKK